MIYLLAGEPRNGKGIMACEFMEQAWLAGRAIITNIALKPGCPFYDDAIMIGDDRFPVYNEATRKGFWEYIRPLKLEGSVLVIDEADVFFDCEDFKGMARGLRNFCKHHGKLKMDCLFIVQNISNLNVRIRRLAGIIWVAEWTWMSAPGFQALAPFIGVEAAKALTTFRRWQFGDVTLRNPIATHKTSYIQVARKFFREPWYDTDQLVGTWGDEL